MQRERLQLWANAIKYDMRTAYDLSGYDTCVSALATQNPEFKKLGLQVVGVFNDVPAHRGHEGLWAIADFFEITTDDAARLTHIEEFSAAERDERGHARKDVILARLAAIIGVPV
jgi:hypothetical protein